MLQFAVPVLAAILAGHAQAQDAAPRDLDILIVNARIVDGSGSPEFRGNIGISDGRIVSVGDAAAKARRTVDAENRVVAPGFIDLMGQNTFVYLEDPVSAQSQLRQGITTHIAGEGSSHAPQNERTQPKPEMVDGEPLRWRTYAEYMQILERFGVPLNVAFNVGATQVREVVIGPEDRAPTPTELEQMKGLVEQAMLDGAHGISTALIYPPGSYAGTGELIELAKVAARYGGFYSTHLRNESAGLLEAIDEALLIGREAGIPVHIYHLKAAGERNWPLMTAALGKIADARARGADVTADIYPYIRHGNALQSFLPPAHFEQGDAKARAALSDPDVRRRLRAEIEHDDGGWENTYLALGADFDKVLITDSEVKNVVGLTVTQAARAQGKDVWDMFFDLVQGETGVAPQSMNEAQKVEAMRAPFVMFETDNGPTNPAKVESAHPRTFGSFPRVLAKYVREEGVLTLEEAIRRMTSLAADRVGLVDRGRIAPGMAADLVIFDPDQVRDLATFEKPLQYAVGMDYVIINGDFAIDGGQATGRKIGRVLRHVAPPAVVAKDADAALQRANEILGRHPVIDGHNDLPMVIRESAQPPRDVAGYDLGVRTPGDTDLERMRQGHLGGQFWSVWVPSGPETRKAGLVRIQLEQIDIALRMIERYPQALRLALTADDIERAKREGRIASLLGIEGGHAIENSLGALRSFHRLGVRYMTLTHTDSHDWASASTDTSGPGLTRFGQEVVREMNRLGMLVDLSHVSASTMHDVLDIAEAPVIFSHSNAMGLTKHERNVPDDVLHRLPGNGGVIMASFIKYFTSEQPRATLEDVADHVEYLRRIAGPDHIGIGSDFYGEPGAMAAGLEDTSTFPLLFAELVRRGWSDEDLIKLSRGNLLRVLRATEQVAARLQGERPASFLTIEQLDGGSEHAPAY